MNHAIEGLKIEEDRSGKWFYQEIEPQPPGWVREITFEENERWLMDGVEGKVSCCGTIDSPIQTGDTVERYKVVGIEVEKKMVDEAVPTLTNPIMEKTIWRDKWFFKYFVK